MNHDEQIDFELAGDSGQTDASSIQPFEREPLGVDTLNRPIENLRRRTEALRNVVDLLSYEADYDRVLLMRSDATFSLDEVEPGRFELSMTGGEIEISPALTPGITSGGRWRGARLFTQQGAAWLPYAGTLGVNDLTLTANAQYVGQRGYADGESHAIDLNSLSLGSNRLEVTLVANPLVAGGVGTMVATVSGSPATRITITYGTLTATTLADVIAFINGDTTSQGSYGLSHLVYATTTSLGTSTPPTLVRGVFQGGYDAESHRVTIGQLSSFFAALEGGVNVNWLRDGEALAIAYPIGPVEKGPVAPRGGRRQSIRDLPTDRVGGFVDNTTPSVGWNLINTGREPEKIPGSIPIGKMINGEFVFVDGTRLAASYSVRLGESLTYIMAMASTTLGSSGALLIGYSGSGSWNADAATSASPLLPASTVETALDNIVAHLAASAATNGGARRVGSEPATGTASTGNLALSLSAGSVRQALEALLNTAATSTVAGGLNSKVSEYGHVLHGVNPIEKTLNESSPENISSGGAEMIRAIGSGGSTSHAMDRVRTSAVAFMEPLSFNFGGTQILNSPETVTGIGGLTRTLVLSGFLARSVNVEITLRPALSNNFDSGTNAYFLRAKLTGCNLPAKNGWYYVDSIDTVAGGITLANLNGTNPDFTGVTSGSLTVYQGMFLGGEHTGQKLRSFHLAAQSVPAIDLMARDSGSVLIRTWDAANFPDPGANFYGARAVFGPATSNPRDTDNILVTGDKTLLDGVETSVAVDATSSHHHGVTYSRLYRVAETPVKFYAFGNSFINLTDLDDWIQLPSAPPGFRLLGAIMTARLQLDTTSASAALASVKAELRAAPGTSYAGNTITLVTEQYLKQNANPAVDQREFYREVTLDCDNAGQIFVNRTSVSASVNSGVSGLELSPRFLILAPTTAVLNQTGAAAASSTLVAEELTITGLTGMTVASVGRFLEITGSGNPTNNGVFYVTAYVSATSVKIRAPFGIASDAGPLTWRERSA